MLIGEIPHQIQCFEHVVSLTKQIKGNNIVLINDSNYLFVYFNISLISREESEKYVELGNWVSRHVIDNYGLNWKLLYIKNKKELKPNLKSYQRHYYSLHFFNIGEMKWFTNSIDYGEFQLGLEYLKEKDFNLISEKFDVEYGKEFDKSFIKSEIFFIRFYNKMNSTQYLSPVVEKVIERFLFIPYEPISIVKYLVLLVLKESIDSFKLFHTVDNLIQICLAYILNFSQNQAINFRYKLNLASWKYDSMIEVFNVIVKLDPFEEILKAHGNLNFKLCKKLLFEEMTKIINLSSVESHLYEKKDHEILPIGYSLRKEITTKMENDFINDMLKLSLINHPNIIPVLGYHIDKQTTEVIIYNSLYQSLESFILKNSYNEKKIAYNIAKGLYHLHFNNIYHSNLNTSSIFICGTQVKIGLIGQDSIFKLRTHQGTNDIISFGYIFLYLIFKVQIPSEEVLNYLEKLKKNQNHYYEIISKCFEDPITINISTIVSLLSCD